MAGQTEYTGYKMTVKYNTSKNLEGVRKVTISDEGGPAPEPLDVTVYADATYTFLTDPLGAKGDSKSTWTVTGMASTASVADTATGGHASVAWNTAQTWIFDSSAGVANANTGTHTALQMTSRTTEIPFEAYATYTIVAESNAVTAWTGPA